MKVHVVTNGTYDDYVIVKIFSSGEKAKKFLDNELDEYLRQQCREREIRSQKEIGIIEGLNDDLSWIDTANFTDEPAIEEWELE